MNRDHDHDEALPGYHLHHLERHVLDDAKVTLGLPRSRYFHFQFDDVDNHLYVRCGDHDDRDGHVLDVGSIEEGWWH